MGVLKQYDTDTGTWIPVVVGAKGEQGVAGPPGEALILTATQPISSGRLITQEADGSVVYYDSANPAHAYTLTGIARNAAGVGDALVIQIVGIIEIIGWDLTPGQSYTAGPNGTLVAGRAPGAVFTQVVGKAITENKFSINPQTLTFI